jgi:heme/copper-type cytochrome/quinol oxidase subunit 2
MKIANRSCLCILFASLLALIAVLSLTRPAQGQNQDVSAIEIIAKKYEYSISPVHMNIGTRVQLKITAGDHDHGFKIATVPDGASPNDPAGLIFTSRQDCWQLQKGETTTIDLLAQTRGTYTFRCCHTCGLGHKGMKGQIVVD